MIERTGISCQFKDIHSGATDSIGAIMIKALSCAQAFILCLGLIFFPFSAKGEQPIIVYFLTFGFYKPVVAETKESIMAKPYQKWTVKTAEQQARLLQILNTGKVAHTFSDLDMRAVVVANEETYLIDAAGVVKRANKPLVTMDKDAFLKFRDSLTLKRWKAFHD